MKWKNRGHEFDYIGEFFQSKKKIFIYGAGIIGAEAYRNLYFLDCIQGFIDNDENKQKVGFCGKPVESIFKFLNREVGQYIVIVAASQVNSPILLKQLLRQGYIEGQDCFIWRKFHEDFLPIYASYAWDKLYIPSISYLPTTYCNLNCAACLTFTHYNKNKRHRELEALKTDVDLFFQWVDYIGLFHVCGGDPLLYPRLAELIIYIGDNYRDKIKDLTITTNGTLIPSPEVCEVIRKYDMNVILDDYTDTVGKKDIFDKIIDIFDTEQIDYAINRADEWIDLKPFSTDHLYMDEKSLEVYYNACSNPFSSLCEGRISSCNYSDYASAAGIIENVEDEYFVLKPYNKESKRELMEFRLGYSEKGYVDFCKQCAGFIPINKNAVSVAVQVKRTGE